MWVKVWKKQTLSFTGGCKLVQPFQRAICLLTMRHLFALFPTAARPKLKKMKSQTGQVGEKQSLKCEAAAGNPQPSYRWFKDGKELNRSRDIRIKYGNGRKNSRLQFNKVKVEDAGEYVCEAENILGKDTVRGRLHVNSVSTTLSSWSGHARKCNETAKSYCVNGGVCYYIEGINQLSCKCPNGFFGQRCLEKLPLRLYMPDPKQSVLWDTPGTGVSSSQWSTSPVCLFLLFLLFPGDWQSSPVGGMGPFLLRLGGKRGCPRLLSILIAHQKPMQRRPIHLSALCTTQHVGCPAWIQQC
uniref:Pro-neuregulin-2, membrane-bound isoform n=1 Tax=Cavia porcellus TaxID=10141 RepID=A0A286Y270_CAVPO